MIRANVQPGAVRAVMVATVAAGLMGADGRPVADARAPHDPEQARKTVAFWERRGQRDPKGAIEWRELAGAYLARQRETGDIADAVRAEAAARRSLAILSRNNGGAWAKLARGLLTQHRFPEALDAARTGAANYDPRPTGSSPTS